MEFGIEPLLRIFTTLDVARTWLPPILLIILSPVLFLLSFRSHLFGYLLPNIQKGYRGWRVQPRENTLIQRLNNSKTYEQWVEIAERLDRLSGTDVW